MSAGWKPSDGYVGPSSTACDDHLRPEPGRRMTPDGYLVEATPPAAWDEYAAREAERLWKLPGMPRAQLVATLHCALVEAMRVAVAGGCAVPVATDEPDYAALEAEHFGDPTLRTGIYAQGPSSTACDDQCPGHRTTIDEQMALIDAAMAAPVAPADDWRQYATEREDTAQQVIERHRAEQDALLNLLADARRRSAPVEPAEPAVYIRKDQLQQAAHGARLCEVTSEPRQDRVRIYTRPAPVAQPQPSGFLLHWPAFAGVRRLVWSESDAAGIAIGCPVEPVYSFGVRKEGGAP